MMSRRWAIIGVVLVAVGVAIALAIWRPWASSKEAPPFDIPRTELPDLSTILDPARLVTLAAVNKSGGPCKLTITGGSPGTHTDLSWDLVAGESRPIQKTSGPFTIEAISVEKGGTSHRQEMNVTVPAGQSREVRVNADGSAEVVAAPP